MKNEEKESAYLVARAFQDKRRQIMQHWNSRRAKQEPDIIDMNKWKLKNLWEIRTQPRKFGISFVVPDRVAVEICDRTRIRGKHPMRIVRVPRGGSIEFHRLVEEAKKETGPMKNWKEEEFPDPNKAYHRSRFNDWHPQVFYLNNSSFSSCL